MNRQTADGDWLWGACLSGYRVDGGHYDADWTVWEQRPGRIAGAATAGSTSRHWERAGDDVRLAAEFGLNAVLIGLEWSRWEKSPGAFDGSAERHYRNVLEACASAGLEPVCVLQMITQPKWFADLGGWAAPESVERFLGFVRMVADLLGERCRYWIPVWEPVHAASKSYREGAWPPGRRNWLTERRAIRNLTGAHTASYALLKERVSQCRVGASVRARVYAPADPESAWDARLMLREEQSCLRDFLGAVDPASVDFLALSLDDSERIRWSWRRWMSGFADWSPLSESSLDDAAYVQALEDTVTALSGFDVPLWLTGAGVAGPDEATRCRRLAAHARAALAMLDGGRKVQGLFHRALLDGFEWHEGFAKRYGLIHVDRDSGVRTPNGSALLMRDIADSGAVRPESVERFGAMGSASPGRSS